MPTYLAFAYISFDVVPAPKGAAIHIEAFAKSLANAFGEIQLVTVSPTPQLIVSEERWRGVFHSQLPAVGKNLIERVRHFRAHLEEWLQNHQFQVIHIRSIYEGLPIALNKSKICQKLIFEVNGLPSIELKYRYSDVAEDWELLQKLQSQEQFCMKAADLIITPSSVTRQYLQSRKIELQKICVIPNGVNLEIFKYLPKPERSQKKVSYSQDSEAIQARRFRGSISPSLPMRLLYFGTLSSWQGVNLAVRSVAIAMEDFPTEMLAIGQASKQQILALKELAYKLGVAKQVTYLEPMSQESLVQQIHQADALIVPLTINDRNLVQGCCPLKVLEGMATGTPVIASDIPAVRELGQDGEHFLLVKPGSVPAIKEAIALLRENPALGMRLAAAARQQIEKRYTWERSGEALIAAYKSLGIG